jgi:hypothetical protein
MSKGDKSSTQISFSHETSNGLVFVDNDGAEYVAERVCNDNGVLTKVEYFVKIGDINHRIEGACYTNELVDDLRSVCGLDSDHELKNILVKEISFGIEDILRKGNKHDRT